MSTPPPAIRTGIAAIFKNEAPYVLEWLAHHRLQGISSFFIADNESTDGTGELLQELAAAGLIEYLKFPNPPTGKPQLPAYRELLRRHGAQVDWMAIIDADEFIWPDPPATTFSQWLATQSFDAEVGAVALNWAVYGSSGAIAVDSGMLTRRMTGRAEQHFHSNSHFKSLVRPEAVQEVVNPHVVTLKAACRYVHADGSECVQVRAGLSETIHWSPIRINHYVVKSWTEYMLRKRPRGTADGPDDGYSAAFFHEHDRNEIADPPDPRYLQQLQEEVDRLRRALSGKDFVGLSHPPATSQGDPAPEGLLQGSLESVHCSQAGVRLTGWALSRQRTPLNCFFLDLDGHRRIPVQANPVARMDVARLFPGSTGDAGFEINVSWEALGTCKDLPELIGQDPAGVQERIPTGPLANWTEARRASEQGCHIVGNVDQVESLGSELVVRGWGLDWERSALRMVELSNGEGATPPLSFTPLDRPDVVTVHPKAISGCGFEARFRHPGHGRTLELIGVNELNRRGLIGQFHVPAASGER